MESVFQTPITIKEAIDRIHKREFLLPAIQRKFIWSCSQIEMLFDSIMRGYPINSFMMWKISASKIKEGYKFYEFLKNYREFYSENNQYINTNGIPDFEAVIDGQQRLTSLYIGLRGTYAYKLPRKWWADNEEALPTRKLYLNLSSSLNLQHDNQKQFDFRFLSKSDIKNSEKSSNRPIWFEVGNILNFNSIPDLTKYIFTNETIPQNEYAITTLSSLYEVINNKRLINYYLEEDQDEDKVLEIFIRTNSGGTPLSFSDLLMSIASANWKLIDARKEIDEIVAEISNIGRPSFIINKDFILKTCLVLFIDNIKFQLKNFTYDNVQLFEKNWDRIRKSVVAAFTLFEKIGFNNTTFRAKNAAIPVIYYIYNKKLEDCIVKATYDSDDKRNIARWLNLTFIKSIFSGQTDSVLVTMRKVLKEADCYKFPIQELMAAFKNDPSKNYSLDDDFIDGLLESQKDSNDAHYVLHLLHPNLDYSTQNIHQDHLHPATVFENEEKLKQAIPEVDLEFARDKKNWNSVLNLQLLNAELNESKNKTPLIEWVQQQNKKREDLFLSENTSLEIKDFKKFIMDRRKNLKAYIQKIINTRAN